MGIFIFTIKRYLLRKLHIEIREEGIFVNDQDYFPFYKSNLTRDKLIFSSKHSHSMILNMLSYHKEDSRLVVEIFSYNEKNDNAFVGQKAKFDIQYIEFKDIVFEKIQGLLSFYSKEKLSSILTTKQKKLQKNTEAKFHNIRIKVNLKSVRFMNGKVQFPHRLKWYKEKDILEIRNIYILKEFEHIKYFFAKLFGRKSIDVDVIAKSSKDSISLHSVFSPQIHSIDRTSINLLKTKVFDEATKERNRKRFTPGELLTFDELIEKTYEDSFGNIDSLEKELLFSL